MELFAFILIACIWAAFLLPSFFESRRKAPTSTTRNFAKSTALLASVANSSGPEIIARRRAQDRRRRTLMALAAAALISLTVAVLRSSLVWLGVTIALDLAIAGYVTMLLFMRQQAVRPAVVDAHAESIVARMIVCTEEVQGGIQQPRLLESEENRVCPVAGPQPEGTQPLARPPRRFQRVWNTGL